MAKQRKRLKKNIGVKKYYHATFNKITHKKVRQANGKQVSRPVVLLTDVYEIHKDGRKVRLGTSKIDISSKGKQVATDHAWIDLRVALLRTTPYADGDGFNELLYGDEIEFSATVKEYPIVRDDVISDRNKLWDEAKAKSDKLFNDWSSKMDKYQNAFDQAKIDKETLYVQYKRRNMSYDDYTAQKQRINEDVQKLYPGKFDKIKEKQNKIMDKVKSDIANEKTVDYELTKLENIKCVNQRVSHYGWTRIDYDASRIKEIPYTKFLAARSMAYEMKMPYKSFKNKVNKRK